MFVPSNWSYTVEVPAGTNTPSMLSPLTKFEDPPLNEASFKYFQEVL